MKKIAWITDTAAQLDDNFIEKNNIYVLPLSVVFPEGSYRESVDLTQQEFYTKLNIEKMSPKTSQPAIGEIVALYEQLKEEGYDFAVALHVSSGLSGTFESAQTAAGMTDFNVYPIDSKIGSFPMVKMIEMGQELFKNGKSVAEVLTIIKELTNKSKLAFIPENLNQLHKSGRVSGTQAFLSNLLNIKVIVSFKDGKPVMTDKVRSHKRAKNNVTSLLRTDIMNGIVPEASVIHCNNEHGAKQWQAELLEEFPTLQLQTVALSICVGVHAGEGTLGLSWITY